MFVLAAGCPTALQVSKAAARAAHEVVVVRVGVGTRQQNDDRGRAQLFGHVFCDVADSLQRVVRILERRHPERDVVGQCFKIIFEFHGLSNADASLHVLASGCNGCLLHQRGESFLRVFADRQPAETRKLLSVQCIGKRFRRERDPRKILHSE